MSDPGRLIAEALSYGFIQRAIVAGSLVALSCSFLGVFLVLRRMSLVGDGLAHVSFATIALGLVLGTSPLLVSLPLVAIASLGLLKLMDKARLYGDAAIGLLSATGIAIGVLLASLSGGFSVDLLSYLFGNILAISRAEVLLSAGLSLVVISCAVFFYHDLFAAAFDEEHAKISGIRVNLVNKVLVVLVALTVVLCIRVVGTMLVSSFIVFPAVTALQVARSFKAAIALASGIAVSCVLLGLVASYLLDWPTGPTIVLADLLVFLIFFAFRRRR
jgi:zinc transport system permease protein